MSPLVSPHGDATCCDRSTCLQVLDLSTSNPALLDIKGPESLSSLWGVLTRCKRSLKDGERLENISWRLWYQACVNASISHGRTQSALDTHPLTPLSSQGDDAPNHRKSKSGVIGIDMSNDDSDHESEAWTSESVDSSDSEVANGEAEVPEEQKEVDTESAPHQEEPEDEGGDDGFETEASSPETPPPRPLPTRPSFKANSGTVAINQRTKSKLALSGEGSSSAIQAKKSLAITRGHSKKRSVGAIPSMLKMRPRERANAGELDLDDSVESMDQIDQQDCAGTVNGTEDEAITSSQSSSSELPLHGVETTSSTTAPISAPKYVSSTAYSSSTPKASSYPTPSASYVPSQTHSGISSTNASVQPPPGIARSRSHLETGASTRHSHSGRLEGELGSIWGQWRRAGERSFGEVVDDVFKVVRVEDLVPKRISSRETTTSPGPGAAVRDNGHVGDDTFTPPVLHSPTPIAKASPVMAWDSIAGTSNNAKPLRIFQDEISPRTTPGLQTAYHDSPLQLPSDASTAPHPIQPTISAPPEGISESPEAAHPSAFSQLESLSAPEETNTSNPATPGHAISMGPLVRVVEPTPAPSRVGSAKELSPLGGRLLASNALSHSFSRLKQQPQHDADSGPKRQGASTGNSLDDAALNSSKRTRLEPTAVGHEGTSSAAKPSARRTTSTRSDRSGLSSGAYTPGSPMVEIDDPMEAAGAQQASPVSSQATDVQSHQSSQLSSSVVQRLNDSATARPSKSSSKKVKHADHQSHHSQVQQSNKKNKKSIFFIQSPGDNRNRRPSARHSSISGGSEVSTDPDAASFAGSSIGVASAGSANSPARIRSTSASGTATSPLAREVGRAVVEEQFAEAIGKAERQKQSTHAAVVSHTVPSGPSRAASDTPAPVTQRRTSGISKTSTTASGLKRSASTAHANAHGHGHRPSVHQMTHATGNHGKNHTTAAANAGGAKRTDSMSNMAGRLREMKANAAAAISARLAAQHKAEKEKQVEQRSKLLAAKRQRSEPDMLAAQQRMTSEAGHDPDASENDDDYEDVDDDTATAAGGDDDEDAWSSATDESAKDTGLIIGKPKPKPKRDPAAIAAAKAAAAEEDAKRKRELFAKRAIFGNGGMTGMSALTPAASRTDSRSDSIPSATSGSSRPGLLTNLFEHQRDVLRKGDSMVNLAEPSHSVPPRVHATAGTRQRDGPLPSVGFNLMNRSKSTAALPIASGISVTTGGLIMSGHSPELPQEVETKTTPIRGKLRLPPKPDEDADFSPSSSPENTSSMLATSEAVRRLEALSNKRRSSARSNLSQEMADPVDPKSSVCKQTNLNTTSALTSELERVHSHPMPMQQSVQFVEPALPQTPTTRRRQMLATELPEDLRLNLLWERRSRATPAYSPKDKLRATASVHDLPEVGRDAEFASAKMSRQTSHDPSDEVAPKREVSPNSAAQPSTRRRSGPNLLSGGNLLRPLTSASATNTAVNAGEGSARQEDLRSATRQPLQRDQRSKSTANVADLSRVDAHRGIGFGGWGGPDFKRRSTDGDNRDATAAEQRLARLKALREREGELSSSFRSHGW